jgi:hypothetical protein
MSKNEKGLRDLKNTYFLNTCYDIRNNLKSTKIQLNHKIVSIIYYIIFSNFLSQFIIIKMSQKVAHILSTKSSNDISSKTLNNLTYTSYQHLETHLKSSNVSQMSPKVAYFCEKCNYSTLKKSSYDKHVTTIKHNEEKDTIYFCEKCNYKTLKKNNYNRHIESNRHQKNSNNIVSQNENNGQQNNTNDGEQNTNNKPKNSDIITPELIILLIQQNKEMQQMIFELAKNAGNHHNTNTINNNDNKSFNLNFFLNETCKNAMNLSDFVNGVVISLDDFEESGRIGYVEGLSHIFCKELKKLHVTERPIHCSDLKRETIYIRENNRWEKDENKEKLLRAVKQIGKKNIKVLTLWQEKYPGYKDVESKENDRYLHILTNIMCGETEEEIESNYGKIMKNISRVTVVNKNL